jgi:hypothetical protein
MGSLFMLLVEVGYDVCRTGFRAVSVSSPSQILLRSVHHVKSSELFSLAVYFILFCVAWLGNWEPFMIVLYGMLKVFDTDSGNEMEVRGLETKFDVIGL